MKSRHVSYSVCMAKWHDARDVYRSLKDAITGVYSLSDKRKVIIIVRGL